jgi:hypothetical protein
MCNEIEVGTSVLAMIFFRKLFNTDPVVLNNFLKNVKSCKLCYIKAFIKRIVEKDNYKSNIVYLDYKQSLKILITNIVF